MTEIITYGYVKGYEQCLNETITLINRVAILSNPLEALNILIGNVYEQKLRKTELEYQLKQQLESSPDMFAPTEQDVGIQGTFCYDNKDCDFCEDKDECVEGYVYQQQHFDPVPLTIIIGGRKKGGL